MKTEIGSGENKVLSKEQAQLREQGTPEGSSTLFMFVSTLEHMKYTQKRCFICPNINSANDKVID